MRLGPRFSNPNQPGEPCEEECWKNWLCMLRMQISYKQMAPIQCQQGFSPTNGTCYGTCPAGSLAGSSDPSICVSTVPCQVGTTADLSGLTCNKTDVVAKGSSPCATGYTEWTVGQCYINCNVYFVESGTFCAKKLSARLTSEAWCSSFFDQIQGNSCSLNTPFLIIFVLLCVLTLWLLFVFFDASRRWNRVPSCL